jgi:hypothetical protein
LLGPELGEALGDEVGDELGETLGDVLGLAVGDKLGLELGAAERLGDAEGKFSSDFEMGAAVAMHLGEQRFPSSLLPSS